mmetsp:Transcript_55313/g.161428  ORF Transcript_55313/g.161428 Transcript_55313/m.161428 type:complete len:211 (+) Transcript_55313:762-1394(+)
MPQREVASGAEAGDHGKVRLEVRIVCVAAIAGPVAVELTVHGRILVEVRPPGQALRVEELRKLVQHEGVHGQPLRVGEEPAVVLEPPRGLRLPDPLVLHDFHPQELHSQPLEEAVLLLPAEDPPQQPHTAAQQPRDCVGPLQFLRQQPAFRLLGGPLRRRFRPPLASLCRGRRLQGSRQWLDPHDQLLGRCALLRHANADPAGVRASSLQ